VTESRAIEVDQYFPHPPARVWRALTTPELIERWLMPNDFVAEVGHRYTLQAEPVVATGFSGIIECEVLELVPERVLRISWASAGSLDSTVTWTLQPEGQRDADAAAARRFRSRRSESASGLHDHERRIGAPTC